MAFIEVLNVFAMLIITVSLCALAVYAIAKVTREALDRLGLDFMTVLLWLGLAERPTDGR